MDLATLSAAGVSAVVRSQCRSRSVGWAKNFITVLRSLPRFLFLDGHVGRDLSSSVLAVAGWRHSGCRRHSGRTMWPGCWPPATLTGALAGVTWPS
jgi:hypothetical protein